MTSDITLLKHSARNPKNEFSCKKKAFCPVDADDKKDKVIRGRSKRHISNLVHSLYDARIVQLG